ncbi:hypothetical protein C900_05705 [Fulvivirga imtechensis AK7]|uniref:Uncharacterized protein n=1 Tax=Fulvivirga imtechensis AK7 TaxID=1237149 RepID=L8JMY8_9BACT|nr:hypothetical protein C900_05705 [Fulvivirga imtechensis AK7]
MGANFRLGHKVLKKPHASWLRTVVISSVYEAVILYFCIN